MIITTDKSKAIMYLLDGMSVIYHEFRESEKRVVPYELSLNDAIMNVYAIPEGTRFFIYSNKD